MILAGEYYNLRVNRISDFGLYLADGEGNEVLLPNRFVSLEDKVDDTKKVFVYHDSEDRLVASTEEPYATVGEVAFLKVVDKNIHGAFLDWGIKAKDLFLPNSNQQGRLEAGKKYVVYIYRDNITGRVVASMRLKGFLSNVEISVAPRQEVEIMVVSETEIGYRVAVENRHWGMIYRNQIFKPVALGDKLHGFVARITEDNRIDISLQKQGYDQIKKSADELLELIKNKGGSLPLSDDSQPEEVHKFTGMSKKTFKRSAGYLMKQGLISMDNGRLSLIKKD